MKTTARFVVLASLAIAGSHAFAGAVILEDARQTFKQALRESNRPKAVAMLHGLLMHRVSIAIDPQTAPVNASGYAEGVSDGLSVWNHALGEELFVMSKRPESSDLIVSFLDTIEQGEDTQGSLKARRTIVWQGSASIGKVTGEMSIRQMAGSRAISRKEIATVTAHELGHLLGLADEPDGDGIMGDFTPAQSFAPNGEEIAAVLAFRTRVKGALRSFSSAR
jgi:hypothetical protein